MIKTDFLDFLNARGYSYTCNEPMRRHTSFRIGGNAAIYVLPRDIAQLCALIETLKTTGIPYRMLGRGTNVLCPDTGYSGCVISTERLLGIERKNSLIRAECGASLKRLAEAAAEHGFVGWAGIAGIPASVGGAIRMNASAFGNAISDHLESVGVFDANKRTVRLLSKEALCCGYRKSLLPFNRDLTVLWGWFRFPSGCVAQERRRQEHNAFLRKERQPLGVSSAGSVFRNPDGDYAARLIELSDMKGCRVGDAEVSKKHANVIANVGNATYGDVVTLISHVRDAVYQKFGVFLTPEIEILRED